MNKPIKQSVVKQEERDSAKRTGFAETNIMSKSK